MERRQLTFRLSGITALCLAVLMAPVSAAERIVILTALSLGIGFSAVMPGYGRVATRTVGPAVLILALIPTTGPWVLLNVIALFAVGFASFNRHGMMRVAPALGLPISAVAFRVGGEVEPTLVLAWLTAVVITLALGMVAWPTEPGQRLQPTSEDTARPVVFGRRRLVEGAILLAIVMPLAVLLAGAVDRKLPGIVLAQPRLGELAGPRLQAHPGLTGGLDTGSPVALSDEIVLRVKVDRPLYWRGTTYEDWDGRRWTSDIETTPLSWSGDGVSLPALPGADRASLVSGAAANGLPEPETVVQQFTAERAGLDVVLGAWRVDSLWSSANRANLGSDGSLRLDAPLGSGATWTIESSLIPASAEDMRRADPALLGPQSPTRLRYGVEDDVSPEVAALAQEITADSDNTYDSILALEAWMDANIVYTRDIPRLAEGNDAVDHLLFESRRGYCEQIGSAMVVMLRSLGIPSRLVVGYVPGSYDATSGEWLSRGTDAHAWAEVYFPNIGWVGFDPTAGVPAAPAEAESASALSGSLATISLVLAAMALVAAGVVYRDRLCLLVPKRRGSAPVDRWAPVVDMQRRFDACGAELSLAWSAATTLGEKGHELEAAGIDPDVVRPVRAGLERLFFDDLSPLDGSGFEQALARAESDIVELESSVGAHLARRSADPTGL